MQKQTVTCTHKKVTAINLTKKGLEKDNLSQPSLIF